MGGAAPSEQSSERPVHAGTNVCAQNNGGCQQLCLFRGGGRRTCACAHGMLSEDGVSCRDYDGYLLYSERTILKSIHLSDENNLNAPIKPFEDAEHMKNVIALAFDYRYGTKGSNRIFYSDIHFGNIQQINDDGTGRRTIVESEHPQGLPSPPSPPSPPASPAPTCVARLPPLSVHLGVGLGDLLGSLPARDVLGLFGAQGCLERRLLSSAGNSHPPLWQRASDASSARCAPPGSGGASRGSAVHVAVLCSANTRCRSGICSAFALRGRAEPWGPSRPRSPTLTSSPRFVLGRFPWLLWLLLCIARENLQRGL